MTVKLNESVSYLKAKEEPLSADVGIVKGREYTWFFDCGADKESLELINGCAGKKRVVLSHFHADHTANAAAVNDAEFFGGKKSIERVKKGRIITEAVFFDDGAAVGILPFPSSHCKSSLVMTVGSDYAFMGDGIYPRILGGAAAYNPQLLRESIAFLEKLPVKYCLISHSKDFVQEKGAVIAYLREQLSALK